MTDARTRFDLRPDEMPTAWFNLIPDMVQAGMPPLPPLSPQTKEPVGPADLAPLFPEALIMQEVSTEPWIDIPGEVIDVYRLWRPAPLFRATRLERALDTPARIYFKYEGVSPAGSHKPNTAVPQAYYNQEAGIRRIATETGAGQWGSAMAMACNFFGLECDVYMVRASYDQKPYRRIFMETFGASVVASPSDKTNSGRSILAAASGLHGVAGHRDQRGGRGRRHARGHELRPRQRARTRAAASVDHRARGAEADGAGGRAARCDRGLRGRRLELRGHRVSVHGREAARATRRRGSSRPSRRRARPSRRDGSPTTTAIPLRSRRSCRCTRSDTTSCRRPCTPVACGTTATRPPSRCSCTRDTWRRRRTRRTRSSRPRSCSPRRRGSCRRPSRATRSRARSTRPSPRGRPVRSA